MKLNSPIGEAFDDWIARKQIKMMEVRFFLVDL